MRREAGRRAIGLTFRKVPLWLSSPSISASFSGVKHKTGKGTLDGAKVWPFYFADRGQFTLPFPLGAI